MDEWEIVETLGTEEEASLVAGYLEAEGIATAIESLLFHQEPVAFGQLGQVHVRVHADDLDRARQLLEDREDSPIEPPEERSAPGGSGE
jgi:hypothetical protein